MGKIRVHEIAKKLDLSSKEVLDVLSKLGIEAKSHMSAVDEPAFDKVASYLKPVETEEEAVETEEVKEEIMPQEEIKEETPAEESEDEKKADLDKMGRRAKRRALKEQQDDKDKIIEINQVITVGELAKTLDVNPNEIIKNLLKEGIFLTINQNLDFKKAEEIAAEFDYVIIRKEVASKAKKEEYEVQSSEKLIARPPVVTVLGHVDHGKTSLLDAIRQTDVASQEAGGITQIIGASTIEIKGRKIITIDTPGHEAFTSMRARGTKVTDIAVLIVAADDGIMPQTIEAIHHAKAAKVPIIVAINKIDLPQANPEKVKQELTDHELLPEDWGGDTICVNISAKKKIGIEELLDMILLVAEMQDIKADPEGEPRGIIIEAHIDKGLGPVATVIVQNGTIKIGDAIIAGTAIGKIRAMINDKGGRLDKATPSTPVEIIGFTSVPTAGDPIEIIKDEKLARLINQERINKIKEEKAAKHHSSLDDLFKQISSGNFRELNLILKADGQGSIEALRHALLNIKSSEVGIKIIHFGVGAINESDIMLAAASDAIIVGFNVKPEGSIAKLAETEGIDVRLYKVIYNVIEDIKAALTGMLAPEYEEVMLGKAIVKQIFKISKLGIIAGCAVTEGNIKRNAQARVLRGANMVFEGKISSLKRFKDDVKEVAAGYECGITIEKFGGLQPDDVIEAYQLQEKQRNELILNESANQQTK
ncbi:MAG: translation initiation factor IF-2 [Armatimonadota bacterium]